MSITSIKASNFKSFKDIDVTLKDYNLLVGANNSGKSNFIELLKFLSDLMDVGLDGAISRQGGVEYIGNTSLPPSTETTLDIRYTVKDEAIYPLTFYLEGKDKNKALNGRDSVKISSFTYSLGIKRSRNKFRFLISREEMNLFGEIFTRRKTPSKPKKIEFNLTRDPGRNIIKYKYKYGDVNDKWSDIKFDDIPFIPRLEAWESILHSKYPLFFPVMFLNTRSLFGKISAYNIDPRLPKKAVPVMGNSVLEEDGNNLALALKNILRTKESRNLLKTHLKDLLPYAEDINIVKILDKSLLFQFIEKYGKKKFLMPSSLISEGTINILSLIVCLYLQDNNVITIEEPERNIHPSLISHLVNILLDSSKKKQIIVTTHSPELIKDSPLESTIFIKRNAEGFSEISRPLENEMTKAFLKEDLGVDDLFISQLLT